MQGNYGKALADAMQQFISSPDMIRELSNRISDVKTMQHYVDEIERIYLNTIPNSRVN